MTSRRALAALLVLGSLAVPPAHAADREAAPRFSTVDVTGKNIDLEDLLAKGPVLLDFWATWCRPCAASLPELERLSETYASKGLTVIGISVDGPRNIAKVRPFAARAGLTFPVVIDTDGSLQRDFHVTAVPTTVLIDATGRIVHVAQGYRPGDGDVLAARIVALTDAPDATAAPVH